MSNIQLSEIKHYNNMKQREEDMEKITKTSNVMPLLITGKQACEILGISYTCWKAELTKGRIKSVSVGNRPRYNRQEIIDFCKTSSK